MSAFPHYEPLPDAERRASTVPSGVRTASDWAWRLLAIVALAGVIIYLLGVFKEIVIALLVALLVTALLQPSVAALVRRRWPKWVAIVLSILVLGAIIAGLVTLVVWQVHAGLPQLEKESVAAYGRARDALRQPPWNISDAQFATDLRSLGAYAQKDSSQLLGGALKIGSTAGHLVAGGLIVLFATIFLLIDGGGIFWHWIARLFPRAAASGVDGRRGRRLAHAHRVRASVQIVVAVVNASESGWSRSSSGCRSRCRSRWSSARLVHPCHRRDRHGHYRRRDRARRSPARFRRSSCSAGVLLVHLLEAHVLQPLWSAAR